MGRKEITTALYNLLFQRVCKPGVYVASEVSIDWGTDHTRYVDVITFDPKNTISTSGIEKGVFACYEVKSSYEDLYSGNGLNFLGEKNYIVTTMNVYKRIIEDQQRELAQGITFVEYEKLSRHILETNQESKNRVGYDVGVLVAIPASTTKEKEFNSPTPFPDGSPEWSLVSMLSCHETDRKRSLQEMLFYMLRASSRKQRWRDIHKEKRYGRN